jgi:hypothetical protein
VSSTGLTSCPVAGLVMSVVQSLVRFLCRSEEKLRNATVSICVRPHGTTLTPLKEFSQNLEFEDFPKICQENPGFIKLGQEKRLLYMKTYVHL